MKVERVGETPENSRVTVVLSSDRYLSETTLLRKQTVELVFDSQTGIRVPTQAVRVEERTVTDPETEEEKQELVTGVYVLVGQQAEFKPVTIWPNWRISPCEVRRLARTGKRPCGPATR